MKSAARDCRVPRGYIRVRSSSWDFGTWADDLDRAVIELSRQDFTTSTMLTGRWLARFPAGQLDTRGLYLHARSLTLLDETARLALDNGLSPAQPGSGSAATTWESRRSPPACTGQGCSRCWCAPAATPPEHAADPSPENARRVSVLADLAAEGSERISAAMREHAQLVRDAGTSAGGRISVSKQPVYVH